jgi:hypothetical protein
MDRHVCLLMDARFAGYRLFFYTTGQGGAARYLDYIRGAADIRHARIVTHSHGKLYREQCSVEMPDRHGGDAAARG